MAETERSAKPTTDHEEIRRWAEERDEWPARVKGTGEGDAPGMIRIDFPGYSGSGSLERISWDKWFQQFDGNDLALLHRDFRHEDGDLDRFNKLVSRQGDEDQGGSESGGGGRHDSSQRRGGQEEGGSRKEYSLEDREYRDAHGEIHHHTNTYVQQHEGHSDKQA